MTATKSNIVKIDQSQKSWYAIYTMPRTEKKVEERLLLRNFETFLPVVSSVRIWSDRKKKVKMPLISGYVFVKIDEASLPNVFQIQGSLGVIRHLGKPAKIRDYELENLRILTTEPESFNLIESIDLKEGQIFEITFGSFSGLIGKYVRHQGKYRAIVEIESIGKMFEVNVPLSFLQIKK